MAAEIREPWPASVKEANVDTLMMKHFLSGFSDKEASAILGHISDIQQPKSHILLFQVTPIPRRLLTTSADRVEGLHRVLPNRELAEIPVCGINCNPCVHLVRAARA